MGLQESYAIVLSNEAEMIQPQDRIKMWDCPQRPMIMGAGSVCATDIRA